MKSAWLFGMLLGVCAVLGLTQTTQELINDGRKPFS